MILEQPQHAIVGAVGRARAHLAQQPQHRPTLPQRMHPAELRPTLPRPERRAEPQNPIAIPIGERLVQVSDAAATALDERVRLVLLAAPRRDVRRDTPTDRMPRAMTRERPDITGALDGSGGHRVVVLSSLSSGPGLNLVR